MATLPVVLKDNNPINDITDNLNGFVKVNIGDVVATMEQNPHNSLQQIPQYIKSFEFDRITNGIGSGSITLVDTEWTVVTQALHDNKGVLSFTYGMFSIDPTVNTMQRPISAIAYNYSLDLQLDYVTINLSILCLGANLLSSTVLPGNDSLQDRQAAASTALTSVVSSVDTRVSSSISEFITRLAESFGYDKAHREIEPTDVPFTKDDLGLTSDQVKTMRFDNSSALNIIIHRLATTATPENKKHSPYVFFITPGNDTGGDVFHFHTVERFKDTTPRTRITLFTDKSSHLKSFTPSYEYNVANIFGGKSVVSCGYNPLTGEFMTVANNVTIGTNKTDPQEQLNYIKVTSPIAGTQNTLSQRNAAVVSSLSLAPLTAELVLVGDVNYNLCDIIDVYVNIPAGPKKGQPHDTSNKFIILGIKDIINEGVFETILQLGTGQGFTPLGQEATALQASVDTVNSIMATDSKAIEQAIPSPDRSYITR